MAYETLKLMQYVKHFIINPFIIPSTSTVVHRPRMLPYG